MRRSKRMTDAAPTPRGGSRIRPWWDRITPAVPWRITASGLLALGLGQLLWAATVPGGRLFDMACLFFAGTACNWLAAFAWPMNSGRRRSYTVECLHVAHQYDARSAYPEALERLLRSASYGKEESGNG